jgi:hypothetical protein
MCKKVGCANIVQTKLAPESVQSCANFTGLHAHGKHLCADSEPQGKCGARRRQGEGFATVKKYMKPHPICFHIVGRAFSIPY